ncbi:MAG TPA: hypothetical protein VIG69_13080 [Candidatus Methylomirabilis sp.]|jgi:hypothetical protein
MSDWANDVAELLAEGLYLHNLRTIVEHCDRGLKEGRAVLPAYVIRSVVTDLHREWDGRAVQVDEARRAEGRLRPALQAAVEAVRRDAAGPALVATLEDLVRAWHSL